VAPLGVGRQFGSLPAARFTARGAFVGSLGSGSVAVCGIAPPRTAYHGQQPQHAGCTHPHSASLVAPPRPTSLRLPHAFGVVLPYRFAAPLGLALGCGCTRRVGRSRTRRFLPAAPIAGQDALHDLF